MWRLKRSKYFEFNWTQIISDWRLVQSLHRSKVRVGMLVFYLEGVEREQYLNASGRDGVLPPHHISAAKFWQLAAIFNRFWPDDCQKGAFSSFGVFNFQRLQEIFSVQSWCAATVNLKNQRLFSKRRWAWWGSKSLTHQKRRKSEGFCCQVPSNPA